MKLAWWVDAEVDAGAWDYIRKFTQALPAGYEVDFWAGENQPRAEPFEACGPARLAGYDHCLYSLQARRGADLNQAFAVLAARRPGVVLFHGMLPEVSPGVYPDASLPELARETDSLWGILQAAPERKKIFLNARGILTFSETLSRQFRGLFYGPVGTLPPVFSAPLGAPTSPAAGNLIRAVFIANAPAGDLEKCLQALKQTPKLAMGLELVFLDPWKREGLAERLQKLILENHLESWVKIWDRNAAEDVGGLLSLADVVIHFQPRVYDASQVMLASALSMGKALVTGAEGLGADLPVNCAYKVNGSDPAAWVRALHKLKRSLPRRRALSEHGREWALRHWSPAQAVSVLAECLEQVSRLTPHYHLLEKVGTELAQLGLAPDPAALRNVSRALASLLGKP